MLAKVTCIPCYFKQVLSGADFIGASDETGLEMMHEVARLVPRLSLNATPAHNSTIVIKAANKIMGIEDPYRDEKKKYNTMALELYPCLEEIADSSANPLETAAKLSVVGNVIDLGIRTEINIDATIEQALGPGFALDKSARMMELLRQPRRVLYLVDNAGEIVFDKLFVQKLVDAGHEVTVGVKSGPILNDATMEDAREVGLDKITDVMETGSDWAGTDLETCSAEFLKLFASADVVVAKGQANYETLEGTRRNLFIILKTKCDSVAADIGVPLGKLVFFENKRVASMEQLSEFGEQCFH